MNLKVYFLILNNYFRIRFMLFLIKFIKFYGDNPP
jgi:hypothetical protein